MSGMWNVGLVGYWRCGVLEMLDVEDVTCSGCGMLVTLDIQDMGCSGCRMFGM